MLVAADLELRLPSLQTAINYIMLFCLFTTKDWIGEVGSKEIINYDNHGQDNKIAFTWSTIAADDNQEFKKMQFF